MSIFERVRATILSLLKLDRRIDEIKINQGRILSEMNACKRGASFNSYEFKVFSQWGEDGILQFLTSNLKIKNRTFIEFGVEDFFESNCRFLLMKDFWRGYVIDGSKKNLERLRASYFFWQHNLHAKAAFVTRENVKELLEESRFEKDLGILSVDIDGVDYFVLSELENWNPCILIVEYNAVFGGDRAVSVPYRADFYRTTMHHSNLYYGASLPAFAHLAYRRGYSLVGVNSAGSNAFFVRRDLLNDTVKEVSLAECFRDSSFREGRDERKQLTLQSGSVRRQAIADMPLVDVVSGESLLVRDLKS